MCNDLISKFKFAFYSDDFGGIKHICFSFILLKTLTRQLEGRQKEQ